MNGNLLYRWENLGTSRLPAEESVALGLHSCPPPCWASSPCLFLVQYWEHSFLSSAVWAGKAGRADELENRQSATELFQEAREVLV